MPTSIALATELCLKFPNTPTKTLARRLYNDNIARFPNLEAARKIVLTARGTNGKKARKWATVPTEPGESGWVPKCPPSLYEEWAPFELPFPSKVLSLSDPHIPFHDTKAIEVSVEFAKKKFKPDVILINGDWMDFYSVSRWERDPKFRNLRREVDLGKESLAWLRHTFPKALIIYKKGNHEERWDHFIWNKAPEIFDLDNVQLVDILELKEYGIEIVGDVPVMAGKLPILHGHELPKGISNPVNAARGAFLRTLHSVQVSHSHQSSSHAEAPLFGKELCCWSQGCLCGLSPKYMRVNKWNLGFAVDEIHSDGEYDVHNYRIGTDYTVRSS